MLVFRRGFHVIGHVGVDQLVPLLGQFRHDGRDDLGVVDRRDDRELVPFVVNNGRCGRGNGYEGVVRVFFQDVLLAPAALGGARLLLLTFHSIGVDN